jgi:hypothetical protein
VFIPPLFSCHLAADSPDVIPQRCVVVHARHALDDVHLQLQPVDLTLGALDAFDGLGEVLPSGFAV